MSDTFDYKRKDKIGESVKKILQRGLDNLPKVLVITQCCVSNFVRRDLPSVIKSMTLNDLLCVSLRQSMSFKFVLTKTTKFSRFTNGTSWTTPSKTSSVNPDRRVSQWTVHPDSSLGITGGVRVV